MLTIKGPQGPNPQGPTLRVPTVTLEKGKEPVKMFLRMNDGIFFLIYRHRFAGPMERFQAEAELINRVNSTYLVRHRSKEFTEYAISIK